MKIPALLTLILVTSSAASDSETVTVAYEVNGQVSIFVAPSGATKKLRRFNQDITGLAIHQGHIYVSVMQTHVSQKDSAIWRLNISGSELDDTKLHVLDDAPRKILSLAVVNGTIYAGRSDGVVWRCSTNQSNDCENFQVFDKDFHGISVVAVAHVDGHIYAVQKDSPIIFSGLYHHFVRCPPDGANSCREMFTLELHNIVVTDVKFAFDAVWVGIDTGRILKCPLKLAMSVNDCHEFEMFDHEMTLKISVSSRYLYVHAKSGRYIWRCDPEISRSCRREIDVSDAYNMGLFVVV